MVSPGRASAAASLGFWYFSPAPTFSVRPTKPSGSGRGNSAPELNAGFACAARGLGAAGGRGGATHRGRPAGGVRAGWSLGVASLAGCAVGPAGGGGGGGAGVF